MNLDVVQKLYKIRTRGIEPRFAMLDFFERCLKGSQYDDMSYEFYDHANFTDTYIPLRNRKPAIVYNLAKILVDRSTDMLFGDEHWPAIHVESKEQVVDADTEQFLEVIVSNTDFKRKWRLASRMGSVGSVVVIFKIWKGKLYHEVLNAKYCTPTYHPVIPEEVIVITELKKALGAELAVFGYNDLEPDRSYWFRRQFTETEEIEYYPVLVSAQNTKDGKVAWKKNEERSYPHDLGFIPGVWISNLPGANSMDGTCTFEDIILFQRELDYHLSQIGRVFHYTGDPLLILKDPSLLGDDGDAEKTVRSAGNAIILNPEGDAKNLEIQAQAQAVAIEFAEKMRKYALEVGRGNRADPEKISSSQSGKALSLLHKDIIGLTSELRTSYGDYGLIPYLRKILLATEKYTFEYPQLKGNKVNPDAIIKLRWGDFFEPTSSDDLTEAQFLTESIVNGTMSEETGTRLIAQRAGISDVAKERGLILKQRDAEQARAVALDQAQQASQVLKQKTLSRKSSAPPEA